MSQESAPVEETPFRILCVDDTELNLDLLVDTLADDFEVSVALDGATALEAVEDERPDLILLDIMMPGMDGYEVCTRLKADEKTQDIPVIFITAKTEIEDETKGFAVGAVDYITKPISPPVVLARAKTHLALKQAHEALQEQNKQLIAAAEMKEEVDRITRHDLKNPLTIIMTGPQLLLMGDNLEEHQKSMLRSIEEAGQDMLSMINFSLDLFKIEQGTYKLNPDLVDLVAQVQKIFRGLEEQAGVKGIALKLLLDDAPVEGDALFHIYGEELLCYSMFGNLIKNAVEASPRDAAVTVKLRAQGAMGALEVHNMGVVPEDIRDRFFEKYATSGKKKGTGLGTYSAKLNAEVQGGGIEYSTSEQVGTSIVVTLPLPEKD